MQRSLHIRWAFCPSCLLMSSFIGDEHDSVILSWRGGAWHLMSHLNITLHSSPAYDNL